MTTKTEEYENTFCPILSHAVLAPTPAPDTRQQVLGLGGALQPAAPPPEAEYIGCQGPSCAWFVRAEGRCAMTLIPMGLGAMIQLQFGDKITPPQH